MWRKCLGENVRCLLICIDVFEIDVIFRDHFAQTSEINLVSSGNMSELWGEPLSDNQDCGLVVFVDLEIDGALKQHLP